MLLKVNFFFLKTKHRLLPYIGKYLQEPFREFLTKQKESLHRKGNNNTFIEKVQ